MTSNHYNVIVIGGGPGGYVAAIKAAHNNLSVALVEKDYLGGTCLNRGCIPTKAMIASTKTYETMQNAEKFGIDVDEVGFNFSKMLERKNKIIDELVNGVQLLLEKNNVTIYSGTASFKNENTISINNLEHITGDYIIIATGSEPAKIPAFNINGNNIITTDDMEKCACLPESLTIIGGGVIGCEYAFIYARLGVKITILELMKTILPGTDKMAIAQVKKNLKQLGVDIKTGVKVASVKDTEESTITTLESGETIEAEQTLISIGRTFMTQGLDIDKIDITMERGRIVVNDYLQTSLDHIYAIGDVIGGQMLAHKASFEGEVVIHNIVNPDNKISPKDKIIPSIIFTDPEIATFGFSEAEIKEQGLPYTVGRFPYAANGKALCLGSEHGFIKVFIGEDKTILGGIIAGAHASSLIPSLAIPATLNIKAGDVATTVFAHPTLGEIIPEALLDAVGMPVHKVKPRKK